MKFRSALVALAALTATAPAMAQHAEPNCPADAAPVPAALAGWMSPTGMTAAADASGLDAATLPVGQAATLALRPTPDVRYALRPENPGGSVSHGGLVGFAVDRAGTYRIAIGSAAWIDVIRDAAAATSVAHGRGPACSGIRKMVDFTLEPGRYVLQIAGNGSPSLAVMIARLP